MKDRESGKGKFAKNKNKNLTVQLPLNGRDFMKKKMKKVFKIF